MKSLFLIFLFGIIAFVGCNTTEVDSFKKEIPFEQIALDCIDRVSIGGQFQVIVDSEEEYQNLIYQKYQRILDIYWDTHYQSILDFIKSIYPGLTDAQYEDSVHTVIYSTMPFMVTLDCTLPEIDFSKHTLLGQYASLQRDKYTISITKDYVKREYNFLITRFTDNEMLMQDTNVWVLIHKIEKGFVVRFEIKN